MIARKTDENIFVKRNKKKNSSINIQTTSENVEVIASLSNEY